MSKSPDAFRTISEVADWLDTPAHVLRFWESKFTQVKPVKRAGGRRYYRPEDMALLGGIKALLHDQGMTIKGAQKLMREKGVKWVASIGPAAIGESDATFIEAEEVAKPPATDNVVSLMPQRPDMPVSESPIEDLPPAASEDPTTEAALPEPEAAADPGPESAEDDAKEDAEEDALASVTDQQDPEPLEAANERSDMDEAIEAPGSDEDANVPAMPDQDPEPDDIWDSAITEADHEPPPEIETADSDLSDPQAVSHISTPADPQTDASETDTPIAATLDGVPPTDEASPELPFDLPPEDWTAPAGEPPQTVEPDEALVEPIHDSIDADAPLAQDMSDSPEPQADQDVWDGLSSFTPDDAAPSDHVLARLVALPEGALTNQAPRIRPLVDRLNRIADRMEQA